MRTETFLARVVQWQNVSMVRKRSRVRFSPLAQIIIEGIIGMATKLKERMVKFRCSLCDRITHYSKRNKKKLKEKLELSKYCRFCKKNTLHKEVK